MAESGLSLCGQGAREADSEIDPFGQLAGGPEVVGTDPEPARCGPAPHDGHRRLRRRDELVRPLRVDPDQNASLPAGGDRHVPPHEEGKAAEHLLLGEVALGARQGPDALGEIFVIRHVTSVRNVVSACRGTRQCYPSSVKRSRHRWASLRSLDRKSSMRASLVLICSANDSLSTRASWSVAFCAASAFLLVAPLVAR
jgi:hypothetical protein